MRVLGWKKIIVFVTNAVQFLFTLAPCPLSSWHFEFSCPSLLFDLRQPFVGCVPKAPSFHLLEMKLYIYQKCWVLPARSWASQVQISLVEEPSVARGHASSWDQPIASDWSTGPFGRIKHQQAPLSVGQFSRIIPAPEPPASWLRSFVVTASQRNFFSAQFCWLHSPHVHPSWE